MTLVEPDGLIWQRKRYMREWDILLGCCSRKPLWDRGMKWWMIFPKFFDGCWQQQTHLHQATTLDACTVFGSSRRIWEKLFIISSLCHIRDSLRNNLIGFPAPSFFFSSTIWGRRVRRGSSFKGSVILRPNSLYLDLIGDMHKETSKQQIALIPLIQNYVRTK